MKDHLGKNPILTNDASCAGGKTEIAQESSSAGLWAGNKLLPNDETCAEEKTKAPNSRKSTNPEMITTRSPHGQNDESAQKPIDYDKQKL
jgi:hypothetical protein